MNVQRYERHLMEYEEFVAHKYILLIVPPILLAIGFFGNVCSFFILRKNIQKASTYTYLCVLAIVDLAVLIIGLLRLWLGQFTEDVINLNEVACKLGVFLGYVSSDTSVWLIVIVTIERFIVVMFPLKTPRLCNLKIARCTIVGIFTVFLLLNMHFLWSVKLQYYHFNNTTITKCQGRGKYEKLVEEVWPWVDAAIYSFVPFFFLIILNSFIIRKIYTARKARNILRQHSSLLKGPQEYENKHKCGEMSMKITVMLLAVSFTFLITTLPMNLALIHSSITGRNDTVDDQKFATTKLLETLAEMLMYVNHSINFFLYCTTGKKFRDQFRSLLNCCGKYGLLRRIRGHSQRISSSVQLSLRRSKTATTELDQNLAYGSG